MKMFRVKILMPELPPQHREYIYRIPANNPQAAFSKAFRKAFANDSPAHGHKPTCWIVVMERLSIEEVTI